MAKETQKRAAPLPAEVHQAGTVLIVQMLNNNATVFNMDMKNTKYEGKDMGDFEITVRRVRAPGAC